MSRNHCTRKRSAELRSFIASSLWVYLCFVILSTTGCVGRTSAGAKDLTALSITTDPANQTVTVGETVTFSVAALGTGRLAYQWMKNRRPIRGATSPFYITPPTTTPDSGSEFSVVVSSSKRSIHSRGATLIVRAAGQLKASLSNLNFGNVTLGSSDTLPVTLTVLGNSNVTISSSSILGNGYSFNGLSAGLILVPGQSATVTVLFAPETLKSATGRVTITSDASNSPLTILLSGSGVQPVSDSEIIVWAPSTSTVVGYNVYRGSAAGGPYAKLNRSANATTSFTDATVQVGHTYYYNVTAVGPSNIESTPSCDVSVTIPLR